MKLKINLVTMKDCADFVAAVGKLNGEAKLISSDGFCVNAKSLLGALAAVEWDDLWFVSNEEDAYGCVARWVI